MPACAIFGLEAARRFCNIVQVKSGLLAAKSKLRTICPPSPHSKPALRSAHASASRHAFGSAHVGQGMPKASQMAMRNISRPTHPNGAMTRRGQADHLSHSPSRLGQSLAATTYWWQGQMRSASSAFSSSALSNVSFSPCGHWVTCTQCALKIVDKKKECPICRCHLLGFGK